MLDWLHHFLNLVLFSPDSDLAWAGLRALTALAGLFTALALRRSPNWLLKWAALGLGTWVFIKVLDDVTFRNPASNLTVYFMVSNLLWIAVLIGTARRANYDRRKDE